MAQVKYIENYLIKTNLEISKRQYVESGLGDFGVRKYDDTAGRFLSIDPLWEKYLAWSPYHYCGNNPVNASDVNGMWLEWGHNKILRFAFGLSMHVSELQILMNASVDADKDQGVDGSYKHAMKAPYQTVEEAKELYNDYLEQQIQVFANTEDYSKALYELGKGMHAISDAWSPTHNGFQTWNGTDKTYSHPLNQLGQVVNWAKGLWHVKGEFFEFQMSDEQKTGAAKDLQSYFKKAMNRRKEVGEKILNETEGNK